jgi:autotransporter-associated beta strand protein
VGVGSTNYNMTANGGGFSAIDGKFTVTLDNMATVRNWGTTVSASPLVGTLKFGSTSSNAEVEMTNNINLNGSNRTIEVTAGVGGDFATMSGVLSNSTGTFGFTKTGTGRLVLTNSNTYNGATVISAGSLFVNGSTHSSSAFSVASGATLAGAGSVNGTVALSGNLAPGNGTNAIGTLKTGTTTWTGGANNIFQFDLAGTSSDKLEVNGAFDKGAGSTFQFNFMGTPTHGTTFTLATFSSTNFNTTTPEFTFSGLGANFAGSTFTLTGTDLKFTAVPEASNLLIVGLLGLGLMSRRRKQA